MSFSNFTFFSRLVPFFYTDINNKTSWVFLGVFPICFLFLFSVYLLCISQPLRQDSLGHSAANKCLIRIEMIPLTYQLFYNILKCLQIENLHNWLQIPSKQNGMCSSAQSTLNFQGIETSLVVELPVSRHAALLLTWPLAASQCLYLVPFSALEAWGCALLLLHPPTSTHRVLPQQRPVTLLHIRTGYPVIHYIIILYYSTSSLPCYNSQNTHNCLLNIYISWQAVSPSTRNKWNLNLRK